MKQANLLLARLDDGRSLLVLDGARAAAAGLDGLDDPVRLDVAVGNGAEDDVLAVQPRRDDGGDEELRAVAVANGLASFSIGWGGAVSPYVLGPALAIDRRKGLECWSLKFSSANFSP